VPFFGCGARAAWRTDCRDTVNVCEIRGVLLTFGHADGFRVAYVLGRKQAVSLGVSALDEFLVGCPFHDTAIAIGIADSAFAVEQVGLRQVELGENIFDVAPGETVDQDVARPPR